MTLVFGGTNIKYFSESNEVFKFSTNKSVDKNTYKCEFYKCDEFDIDRLEMLKSLEKNTDTNSKVVKPRQEININKKSETKNDSYIKLLESSNRNKILEKLDYFRIAFIYLENEKNILKLTDDKKCILSYKKSIFANKIHIKLFNNLKKSIENFLIANGNLDIIDLCIPKKLPTPKEIFNKTNNFIIN